MLRSFRSGTLLLVSAWGSASSQGQVTALSPCSHSFHALHTAEQWLGAVNAWILFHLNTLSGVPCLSQGRRQAWLTLAFLRGP